MFLQSGLYRFFSIISRLALKYTPGRRPAIRQAVIIARERSYPVVQETAFAFAAAPRTLRTSSGPRRRRNRRCFGGIPHGLCSAHAYHPLGYPLADRGERAASGRGRPGRISRASALGYGGLLHLRHPADGRQ
ncbi:hypothetical protein SDC9_191626 [bioreactor metagenome]|uniref:Uncharacterized protein n=1 Tax=bioreactor metagenome TaxID=1076179 RepID=A0A645HYE4_9ZZZZ